MARILLLTIALTISHIILYGQSKSSKRGVGYGFHSQTDMENYSEHLSWWYNWATQPDADIRSNYHDYPVEFVPMAWNAAGISGVNSWVAQDTAINFLLGFNEPNFKDQADMTPTQAATAWPAFENIANQYDLKTVSPAVNYCGNCVTENGITYNNPFTYLDDFFEHCTNCKVDYIALHWYGGGASIQSYVNDARKYGKPIWVTEFAAWDNSITNLNQQKQYLAGTVNFLERDPDVFRYAWFIGRTTGGIQTYPFIDLYAADGQLTELGQLYFDIPVYNPEYHFPIPGRIEVEEYYSQSGLFCEITSDTDGFLNIGWTETGDYADYNIEVAQTADYTLNARIAGTSAGEISILIDSVQTVLLKTPNTNGWQNWKTISSKIQLTQGKHRLRMNVKSPGFNINWLSIGNSTSIESEKRFQAELFPNPVNGNIINVTLQNNIHGSNYTYKIFNASGTLVCENVAKVNGSMFQINLNTMGFELKSGIYLLQIADKNTIITKRFAL